MRQQKLQWGPLCPRQHCPTAWKNVSQALARFTPRVNSIHRRSDIHKTIHTNLISVAAPRNWPICYLQNSGLHRFLLTPRRGFYNEEAFSFLRAR
jgi:hypothetical protein